MPQQLLDPWKSFFGEIDSNLNQEVTFHCLGGFVAKILYGLPRDTSDVDVLPIATNREIDSVISTAIEGSSLRLLALDPYDLALSKLERNSQRDRDDVKHLARVVPFDLETLRRRFDDELQPNLAIPDREALTLQLWIDSIEEERNQGSMYL